MRSRHNEAPIRHHDLDGAIRPLRMCAKGGANSYTNSQKIFEIPIHSFLRFILDTPLMPPFMPQLTAVLG